ncbi:MAG: MTH938/NDUFAF3 family protein [candidate division WOR-3 bacterium]
MNIEKYSFGRITINGKTYTKDVIIFQNKVLSPWWREEGHSLSLNDLKDVINASPELIIIGTGAYGVLSPKEETIKKLKEMGIETIIARTTEAVKIYNETSPTKKVVACLHLTC